MLDVRCSTFNFLLRSAGFDSRFQRLVIRRRCRHTGPFHQFDGVFGTTGGTNAAADTKIQIDVWHILVTHGDGPGRTPIDAGFTGRAELSIPDRVKTGVEADPRLGLGQGGLQDHAVASATVADKIYFLAVGAAMHQTGLL